MDYFDGIVTVAMIAGIIGLVVMADLSLLTALSNAVLGASIVSLLFMVLIEVKHGWNDDRLAPYAFLESLTLIALGFHYLVQQHAPHDTRP